MQALYFMKLFPPFSSHLLSLSLSLLLPFRPHFRRFSSLWAALDSVPDSVSLYEGTVWHERRHPVHNSFRFPVRYALIDLDKTPYVPPNHLSADEARKAAKTNGPLFLLVIPPSVGYQRSPVTLYYCYDHDENTSHTLKQCIAEVLSTPWVEKVLFTFDPNSTDVIAKTLHVSPFMDMLGELKQISRGKICWLQYPLITLYLADFFRRPFAAKQIPSSWRTDYALFFWLMPHKAAIMTYWQAFKLRWKKVPFFEHPKCTNRGYIKEGLVREAKLQGCRAFSADIFMREHQLEGTDSSMPPTRRVGGRSLVFLEGS